MTRTLLVRNKQPQHSLPDISHKQTKSVKKIRCKRATVAPYLLYARLGSLPRPGSEEKKYGANAPQLRHIAFAPAYEAATGCVLTGGSGWTRRHQWTTSSTNWRISSRVPSSCRSTCSLKSLEACGTSTCGAGTTMAPMRPSKIGRGSGRGRREISGV